MSEATISVDGSIARNIAKSTLDSLGLSPDEVDTIEVWMRFGSGNATTISVDGTGPEAGAVVRDMVRAGVETGGTIESVEVTVLTEPVKDEPVEDEPVEDEPVEDDDDGDKRSQDSMRGPHRSEPRVDGPQRVDRGSTIHAVLDILDRLDATSSVSAVLGSDAAERFPGRFDRADQPENGIRAALSKAYIEYARVDRRKVTGSSGGASFEYWLPPAGQSELDRLGEFDHDADRAVSRSE